MKRLSVRMAKSVQGEFELPEDTFGNFSKILPCTSHVSWSIRAPSFQKHLSIAGKIFHTETCSLADKVLCCLSGYGM